MLLAGLCSKVGLWLCSMVRLGPLASWTVQSPPVQRGCRLFPARQRLWLDSVLGQCGRLCAKITRLDGPRAGL